MSDLRDELEQQFTSAETQSEAQTVNDVAEQTQTTPAEVDEWLNAPAAYTKEQQEKFKTWPMDARKQIIEREKQVERGFSDMGNKINGYKYIDDLFNGRQERLKEFGINSAKEWAEYWALISDGLHKNPQATIEEIKNIYGLNGNATPNNNTSELMQRLNAQERQLQALDQAIKNDKIKRAIDAFVSAKDDAGNPKYPYFDDVKQNIGLLMDSGVCKSLEEAYNQSIWANEDVRKKLIEAQQKADLAAKTEAAAKAKDVGFNPSSKATAPEKEEDLREMLERQFDEIEQ
jgi:hypothetical protein